MINEIKNQKGSSERKLVAKRPFFYKNVIQGRRLKMFDDDYSNNNQKDFEKFKCLKNDKYFVNNTVEKTNNKLVFKCEYFIVLCIKLNHTANIRLFLLLNERKTEKRSIFERFFCV